MRRIRWGRVGVAGAGLVGLAAWGASGADEEPVAARRYPGTERCAAGEVLAGVEHGGEHDPGGDADAGVAAVVLAATRCHDGGPPAPADLVSTFLAVSHTAGWAASHERPAVAVDHLLDLWELAADQRRAGNVVEVLVWNAVAKDVVERLPALLHEARLPPGELARARGRIGALTRDDVDWDAVSAREVATVHAAAVRAAAWPAYWGELPFVATWWWEAHTASGRPWVEAHEDVARTAVLAELL